MVKHPEITRFTELISKPDINGCQRWLGGSTNSEGRPKVWTGQKHVLVSRKILGIKLGRELQPTELACHTCDNPWCIAADHLWAGTDKENTLDSKRKGRLNRASGECHGRSKLTERQVANIRLSKEPSSVVAKKFNVGYSTIRKIKRGQIWKR